MDLKLVSLKALTTIIFLLSIGIVQGQNPLHSSNKDLEKFYSYLKTNYQEVGDSQFKQYKTGYSFKDARCHWYQEFSEYIVYEYDSCTVGGYVAIVYFPSTVKLNIALVIEQLYKSEGAEWLNAEKTIFGRKLNEVGFICEIVMDEDKIVLRICEMC